jgi:hypothetical protein
MHGLSFKKRQGKDWIGGQLSSFKVGVQFAACSKRQNSAPTMLVVFYRSTPIITPYYRVIIDTHADIDRLSHMLRQRAAAALLKFSVLIER